MAEGHPPAAAMASYRRSRLPFARPQTLQTLQKSAQLRREKGTPTSPTRATPCHAQRCRQKPPQGHSNGSRAPHGRSNGLFYRRSRLPFARPQTLQTMAQGHPTVAAMAAYRHLRLPFPRPQTLQTLQILHKSTHLRRQKVPQQAQHAPLPHAQATTRPQQWLKGTPRPQQWLLIGVQGCRLPGLKRSKPSKRPPSSAGKRYHNKPNTRHSRTQKPPQGHSNG